jgi:NAD(P) transhydrogenase subunit alpha
LAIYKNIGYVYMVIGVLKETAHGEKRVALVPEGVERLCKAKLEVVVQAGAGSGASISDEQYQAKGAVLLPDADTVALKSDLVVKVRPPMLDPAVNRHEVDVLKEGSMLMSFLQPLTNIDLVRRLGARKITCFSMDLIPRITRAQPMDALSSMSTIMGYKCAIMAANLLGKFFPLLMTAAGTVSPARVLVMGAGVAGLQAIATCRRLGAVVEAYDVRPAVKTEIESLGAKFVQLDLETKDAQDAGGYAKAQSEEFLRKQRELVTSHVRQADVVITTALIPGKRAPILVTEEMVKGMRPGSVIVDMAAEQGGNCEITEPGKDVVKHGVIIAGLVNIPSTMPTHSSQMYSRNVTNYLLYMARDGSLNLDLNDEMVKSPLVTHNGEVMHEPTKNALKSSVS